MANIPGVPETISRKLVLGLLQRIGLETRNVYHLGMNSRGIYAQVFAHDEKGLKLIDQHGDPVFHTVFVRFED